MSADKRDPGQRTLSDRALLVLGYISREEYERRERGEHRRQMRARLRLVVDNTQKRQP